MWWDIKVGERIDQRMVKMVKKRTGRRLRKGIRTLSNLGRMRQRMTFNPLK
jgi:hypothetical protein